MEQIQTQSPEKPSAPKILGYVIYRGPRDDFSGFTTDAEYADLAFKKGLVVIPVADARKFSESEFDRGWNKCCEAWAEQLKSLAQILRNRKS